MSKQCAYRQVARVIFCLVALCTVGCKGVASGGNSEPLDKWKVAGSYYRDGSNNGASIAIQPFSHMDFESSPGRTRVAEAFQGEYRTGGGGSVPFGMLEVISRGSDEWVLYSREDGVQLRCDGRSLVVTANGNTAHYTKR